MFLNFRSERLFAFFGLKHGLSELIAMVQGCGVAQTSEMVLVILGVVDRNSSLLTHDMLAANETPVVAKNFGIIVAS